MVEFFPGVSKINYEGPETKNPLAFRHYNAGEVVAGKTMGEHLRFSVAYWHTLCNGAADPFGSETRQMPWNDAPDAMAA